MGWQVNELSKRSKGAKAKVRLAGRLRKETTMTLKRIAERLHMGSWTYVSNLLQAQARPAHSRRRRRSVKSEDRHLHTCTPDEIQTVSCLHAQSAALQIFPDSPHNSKV